MKKDGKGGRKTVTGLRFEKKVDLYKAFTKIQNYKIVKDKYKAGISIYYDNQLVARCLENMSFINF